MVHNDDAMNKIPLKSASGLDDEEKNGGEFIQDTNAAEEARRERMRANLLKWMKKLTIVLICFIGIALISYVIISLCFSDWPKSSSTSPSTTPTTTTTNSSNSSLLSDDNNSSSSGSSSGSSNQSNSTQLPQYNNATSPDGSDATSDANANVNVNATPAMTFGVNDRHESADATSAPIVPPTAIDMAKDTTTTIGSTTSTAPVSAPPTATTAATTAATAEPQTQTVKQLLPPIVAVHDEPITTTVFESKLNTYENAAVCSDKEVCSRIGSNILQQGGSAVDSAIAGLLCNGIVTMHSMGIGGGMLMNVFIKDAKEAYWINAREVAPLEATEDMFEGEKDLSLHGGLSIAVPGELKGYHVAHKRFGKLPWKSLVEPSIKLCHEGFYLSKHQHNALQHKWQHMKNNTMVRHVFVNVTTGELFPVGTKLQAPKELCSTYELLAENGPLDFYNGTLAKLVVEDLKELGSIVGSDDLESYIADEGNSITMKLNNSILYVLPPISSGSVVANILSILEGYNFTKEDLMGAQNEAKTIHRFAEALKFGFAKRWDLGDERVVDTRELVSQLTDPKYNVETRAKINDSTVLNRVDDYGAQFMGVDDVGTSHLAVLAPNGDAVSVTSSVNDYFGCGQLGRRTGILFNSGMNDFSVPGQVNNFGLPPAPANFISDRNRAMSSMSPIILADENGDVHLLVGAAGGSKIISAIVEIAARVLWFGQNIKEAIDAPRFHHQLLPNVLEYQGGGFSEEVIKLLQAKGHIVKPYIDIGSVACGIMRNSTGIYANADYRKQGATAGF